MRVVVVNDLDLGKVTVHGPFQSKRAAQAWAAGKAEALVGKERNLIDADTDGNYISIADPEPMYELHVTVVRAV